MRHPRAEQDHAEIDGVLYGSDERAERIELDEFRKKGGWIYRLGAVPCCSVIARPILLSQSARIECNAEGRMLNC